MSSTTPTPSATPPAASSGRFAWWPRFAQRHLHDYNPAATRRWLAVVLLGWAAVLLAAGSQLLELEQGIGKVAVPVAVLALVAVVAAFPIQIPRSKYSLSVSDMFVFALLALQGLEVAVLASAIEGAVGVFRASKRWSSRLSTPAAAALAMAASGIAFEALVPRLAGWGFADNVARLLALCTIALPYFALGSLPLIAIMAAKTGKRLSLRDWIETYGWHAGLVLFSSAVAGTVVVNVHQFGPAVGVAAVVLALVMLTLINVSLRAHARELDRQDAAIGEAQREAEHNQRRFTAAFAHAAIGMAIVRPDGRIHQVNQALSQLLGRPEAELVGDRFEALLHAGDTLLFRRHAAETAGGASIEVRCVDAAGDDIWVALHCSRFADPLGGENMVYQLHDISSRRRAEGRLQHIAYHDSLTDLANRNGFHERLEAVVERSRTDAAQRFAVFFLDLDRFKVVNDSLGHAAGNEMLREVAARLTRNVRPSDLVARLGGDEFAVLLDKVCEREPSVALAERLLAALGQPMRVAGAEVTTSASIGITFSDMAYRTADEVVRDADLAMYAAKNGGRGRISIFDSSMLERIAERMTLEGELRRAIAEGQMTAFFQPLFDLEPYRVSGFEALVRWIHPTRGYVSPAVFIPLAEETGQIGALTRWMIDRAAGQLVEWQARFPGARPLTMNVNISGRDLADPLLVPHVREVLERHRPLPFTLTLEITETTLMGSLQTALDALNQLRALGVRFSIDDFGTGYSSLSYLSTLPIDSLKIDRSFVVGLETDAKASEIVRAVLNLGLSLGKKVVAEGIETRAQFDVLRGLGVHVGQGYLMAKPMHPAQVEAVLVEASLAPLAIPA